MYMQGDVNCPIFLNGFSNDNNILSVRDLDFDKQSIGIRLRVYDMDGIEDDLIDKVKETIETAATLASPIFPILTPNMAGFSFGIEAFKKLVNSIDDHDKLIDERIWLHFKPTIGRGSLRVGYLVCFSDNVNPGFKLKTDILIAPGNAAIFDSGGTPYINSGYENYAILKISKAYSPNNEYEISQKMAKLISELNGKGSSGKASITFLKETMEIYDIFNKLQRINELKRKKKTLVTQEPPGELSEEENKLLEDLINLYKDNDKVSFQDTGKNMTFSILGAHHIGSKMKNKNHLFV